MNLLIACILILLIIVIIPLIIYILQAQIPKKKIVFEDSHLPIKNNIEYYRDVPINYDILRAYGIAINFKIIKNKSNLIGALLLRWLKFGYIQILKTNLESGYSLQLPADLSFDNEIEQTLLDILRKASGDNHILEYEEFKSYCYINYIDILRWFDTVDYYAEEILKIDGCIKEENVTVSKMFNLIVRLDSHKIITKKATNKAIELLGFKKYLLNYSNISNKTSAEVALWEDYLIFAQLLGIANRVDSDFDGIYSNYDTIINMHHFSNSYWHLIHIKKTNVSNKFKDDYIK